MDYTQHRSMPMVSNMCQACAKAFPSYRKISALNQHLIAKGTLHNIVSFHDQTIGRNYQWINGLFFTALSFLSAVFNAAYFQSIMIFLLNTLCRHEYGYLTRFWFYQAVSAAACCHDNWLRWFQLTALSYLRQPWCVAINRLLKRDNNTE